MHSLRARLILLLAAAAALPLAVVLVSAVRLRRLADQAALTQARLLASLTASGYEELLSASRQLVENYVASDEVQGAPPTCPGSMRQMVRRYPHLLNFGVVAPDGRILCSILAVPAEGATFAGMPFLADVLASTEPVVSDYAVGPIAKRGVVFVAQAARDAAGRPTAIVVSSIDLDKLLEIGEVGQLPPGASLRVVDRHGTILARFPDNDRWQGRPMGVGPDTIILQQDSGAVRFRSLDGVERRNGFVAFRPGGPARIAVVVGLEGAASVLPIEQLLNRGSLAALLALLTTIALVAVGGRRLLLDDVHRLQDVARALGRGDFAARAGVPPSHGELAQLGDALGDLGRELATRETRLTELLGDTRLQRDELRALYDALPVAIVGLTAELEVRSWSAGAERLFGWRADEVIGRPPPLVPEEERADIRRRVQEVIAAGRPMTYQAVRRTRDGGRLPVNISLAPAFDAEGRANGALSVFIDISDLREAQERTARAEASLRAVVEAAPLAIMAVDTEHRATLWSGGAERLFGIPAAEVVGAVVPLPQYGTDEGKAEWSDFIARALAGESFSGRETAYALDGHDRLVTDTGGAPIRDDAGRITGAVFAMLDITPRIQAESRLAAALDEARATRDHLRAIYDAAPAGVLTALLDGTVLEWSPGMERIFGWTRAEVLGERAPWVLEGRTDEFRQAMQVVASEGRTVNFEAPRRRKDGREIIAGIHAAPLRDRSGRTIGAVGVVTDVTERRALEERERQAQARLAATVAAVPVGIMAVDADRRVTLWSEGGERLFGLPAERIVGRVVPDEVEYGDAALDAAWRELHDRVLAGETITNFEHTYDPTRHPLLASSTSAVPMRDESGRVTGAVYAISDISERKRAEQQLAAALAEARGGRDRLAAIVAASPVAIVRLDAERRVRLWSPAAERIFGWSAAEVLGEPLPFTHASDLAQSAEVMTTLMARGSLRTDMVRHRKDGTPVWVSAGLVVLHTPDGTFDGFLGIMQNVTREREAQERVAVTVEELRRLSAHLNHVREAEQERLAREVHDEFGQLLTGLKLDLTLLDRQLPDAPITAAARQRIPQMRDLVDELVAAGRRIVAELRPPALDRLGLGAAIDALATDTSRRGLAVTAVLDADTTGLDPDTATALYRIAQEGLTNVLKHSGATEAQVRLDRADGRLRLAILDNGRGLPASRGPGGVGLISMRERAALVGGTLRIETRPAGGTSVTAEVPWVTGGAA